MIFNRKCPICDRPFLWLELGLVDDEVIEIPPNAIFSNRNFSFLCHSTCKKQVTEKTIDKIQEKLRWVGNDGSN